MYPVYDDDGKLIAIFSDKESVQRLLGADFDCTTEGATQIGAQRATPASPAQINAQTKQAREALDPAGEQGETKPEGHCGFCYDGPPQEANPDDPDSLGCEDGQVEAGAHSAHPIEWREINVGRG